MLFVMVTSNRRDRKTDRETGACSALVLVGFESQKKEREKDLPQQRS